MHKIASALAEHRQFLPLAVPFANRATAGGTIASGIDSPLRQLYGTARDFVLGMEFVTGDGIAAKSGGRVVKNVTGYDIHKMMIGALGTLGVITQNQFSDVSSASRDAELALRRFADRTALANCVTPSPNPFFGRRVSKFSPRAENLTRALGLRAAVSFENNRWSVMVSFAGDEQVLDRDRRELEALARAVDRSALESFTELRAEPAENVNRHIADMPSAILEQFPAAAIFKISALPTDLAALADAIRSIEIPWTVMMRGLGVTYLALLPPDRSEESLRLLKEECARIFSLSGKAPWGRSVLLWCPPELKNEINVWGEPAGDFALMQKLKNVFDPSGILSPGRFVGGI